MASLYTDVLASFVGLTAPAHLDVPCPAGKRMIVIGIDCAAGAGAFTPLLGFEDLVTGGTWLTLLTNGVLLSPGTIDGASTLWSGRQAFNFGGGFRLNPHIGSWDGRVTGWLLDLP